MGKYKRRGERVGEVAVMEVGHGGARTRTMEVSSSDESSKRRRKVDSQELLQSSSSSSSSSPSVQLVTQYHCSVNFHGDDSDFFATSDGILDHVSMSPLCCSNESRKLVKHCSGSPDLKGERLQTEISMFISTGFSPKSREPSPTSEFCGDSSGEMDSSSSSTKKKPSLAISGRKPAAPVTAKMPSMAEIEEFFSVAEKNEQKRFTDKYNYDIVKDVPLDGRYQWVRLNH